MAPGWRHVAFLCGPRRSCCGHFCFLPQRNAFPRKIRSIRETTVYPVKEALMRIDRVSLAVAGACLLAAVAPQGGAQAATMDEVVARLNAVEKENATLRDRVKRLEAPKAAKLQSAPAAAPQSVAAPEQAYASAVYKAPMYPAAFSWTGCYVGGNIGDRFYSLGDFGSRFSSLDGSLGDNRFRGRRLRDRRFGCRCVRSERSDDGNDARVRSKGMHDGRAVARLSRIVGAFVDVRIADVRR